MDEHLRRDFLPAAEELLDALSADLRALRGRPSPRARRALIDSVFRRVHSLKGTAAALPELEAISQLAHEFESALEAARGGRLQVDDELLDVYEDAAQALTHAVALAARGEPPQAAPQSLSEKLLRLARPAPALEPARAGRAGRRLAALPEELEAGLTAAERQRLLECLAEDVGVVGVEVALALGELDESFRRLTETLGARGELIATLPGGQTAAPDQISFRFVLSTDEAPEEIARALAEFGARVRLLLDENHAGGDEAAVSAAPSAATEDAFGAGSGGEADEASAGVEARDDLPPAAAEADARASSVRVSLRELDELVYVTHELFTDVMSLLERAASGRPHAGTGEELRLGTERLRREFVELEERALALRMVPLAPLLERAARAGRSVARAAGKEVEFEYEGGEARLDKLAAERLADPLLHLLRNAVDHGIEPAEERRRAGKPERGRVRLEVETGGVNVRVRVSDDGRGLDLAAVARAALAQGLAAPGEAVTQERALRLIFRPGFSTAARVSDVSGRGVGLDAVERAVEEVGGQVRVRTCAGRGTTFELRLPLALALAQVVLVRAGRFTYALDAGHVIEAGAPEASAAASEVPPPRIHLSTLLGQTRPAPGADEAAAPAPPAPFLLARVGRGDNERADDERVLIAVDELLGRREVLVRSLGRHAARWPGVGGAVHLRDDSVALLLELPQLWQRVKA